LLGKEYEARKKLRGGDRKSKYQNGTLNEPQGKTAQLVADEHGVGYGTVVRAEEFAKGLDAVVKSEPRWKHTERGGISRLFPIMIYVLASIHARPLALLPCQVNQQPPARWGWAVSNQ